MPFEVIITDLNDLIKEKALAREADMQAILENRSSVADIHCKNAFFRQVRDWTDIDMGQSKNHFDDEDDLYGGTIAFDR
ncbi:hypothetical protein A4U49_06280 [Acidithiobacillus ferrivorans]|uniref:hypothetical protein n=1 Tax=Acidithiobacillus ferrivorans TaxID=160808 RepID=UPI0008932FFD|nr:hypothetical protein [Acidithiobacillus ferrivorans]OFA16652.1 hypothetical protein A4U49_06280 [Acidithiobacillus ferrivorans]